MKAIRYIIALCALAGTQLWAGEADHGANDAFMAEAASLLPVASIIAPGAEANAQIQQPSDKAIYGNWGPVIPWPFIPVTAANLPDGRVLTFASNEPTNFPVGSEFTYAGVWNPATGMHTQVNNDNHDMFCAATAMSAEGKPVFSGGRNAVRFSTEFDFQTNQWTRNEDMNDSRWYATANTLPNGSMVLTSGNEGSGVRTVERFTPGSGWTRLLGVPWVSMGVLAFPHNFVAPDGRVIYTGPRYSMTWFDPAGRGEVSSTSVGLPGERLSQSGGVAMYDVGKVITAGGGVLAGGTTNLVHTADINAPLPVVTEVAPMNYNRRYHNALVLPDGDVIVIGGNTSGIQFSDDGTIYTPEVWSPNSNTWTELADMAKPRNYHSVALVLPDGRIFSGGGGLSNNAVTNHQDAQIFSPPYLFNADGSDATRPVIESAPSISSPGNTIIVEGSDSITRFTMIRMTATTHAFSSDVRFLNVSHTNSGVGQYSVSLHPSENVLLPGYWMLFALDADGTPSLSRTIKIMAPTPPSLTSPCPQHSLLGTNVDLTVLAEDGDGDPLTYTATGLPTGLSLDPATGKISGNPQAVGTFTVQLTVSDGESTDSGGFDWEISQDSGLVAHWEFDEGGGSFAADSGGTGTTGTLENGPRWVEGKHAGAISFNGIDERVVFPNHPDIEFGKDDSDFSVTFWMRLGQDTTEVDRAILRKGNAATDNTVGLWLAANSTRLRFGLSLDIQPNHRTYSPTSLPFEQWAHIGLVREGAELTLYIDGKPDTSLPIPGTVVSNAGPLYLGDSPWELGTRFHADELAIYNRALSSSEVTFIADPANRVIGINSPPFVVSPGDMLSPTIPINLPIAATDGNGDTLTFSHNGQLPAGLTLDPSSGLISGTPTTTGFYLPEIYVSDGIATTTVAFEWAIAPHFVATTNVHGPIATGSTVSYTITTDGQDLSYEWDFGDGTPPSTSTASTQTHSFSQPGRYIVTTTLTDTFGQTLQVSTHQAVYQTLTALAPSVSQSVIYEPRSSANDRLWNVNPDNASVTVSDVITGARLVEIPVGNEPRSLALAPGGEVWVSNKKSATISRISTSSLAVVGTIDLPHASQPYGIAFAPSGAAAYVCLEATGQLASLNPVTGAITATADVGEHPRHLSINHDGSKAYVSRFVTPPVTSESSTNPLPTATDGGEVIVVSTSTMLPTSTITLQTSTRPDTSTSARGIPNYLGPASISPDGTSAWVGSKQDNIQRGIGRDGYPLTHDSTVRSIISRIDLATGVEQPAARIDHDNSSVTSTTLFDTTGNFVFSALESSREVAITDVFNGIEIKRFQAGRAPQGLALSPDGRTLYVHNFTDRSITSHDLSAIIDGTGDDVPQLATVDTVTTESLTPQVFLGKQLFYDAQDTNLTLESYMSCAACHDAGAQDGRVWDLTGFGEGLRNTIDLRGRAGTAHGRLHWSANFDEVQDFEGQIRNLAGGSGLISSGAPHAPLGTPNAGRSADLDALAAYVASLDEFDPSPHRQSDSALSEDGVAGKRIFSIAGCADCHGGSAFTDSLTLSLHNIGTIKPTSGQRLGSALPGIDSPTLRGVASGAPYLHDGSAPTLADAVLAHPTGASLTETQLAQVVSYLLEIDGTEPAPVSDSTTPDSNTVALYHFDGDFSDAGPKSHHLTPSGGVTLNPAAPEWMHQPAGQSVRFSNIGDTLSVTIPDADILPATGAPFSLEARIFPRNYLGYSVGDTPIISLYQEWDTSLELIDSQWGNDPRGPIVQACGTQIASAQLWADAAPPGSWHHLKISYDGNATVSLWINQTLVSSISMSPNAARGGIWTLSIGNFDGDLDELLITRSASTPPTPGQSAVAAAIAASNLQHGAGTTYPLNRDTDGDGISDLTELAHGSDPEGLGSPAYHLGQYISGTDTFTTYSFPVPITGTATNDGYTSAAFSYEIEATADFKTWARPVLLESNPAGLPAPPAGHRYITFRHQSPTEGNIFFRTRVWENQ